jgi:hypothetical protein
MKKKTLYFCEGYHFRFDNIDTFLKYVMEGNQSKYIVKDIANELGYSEKKTGFLGKFSNSLGLVKSRSYTATELGRNIYKFDPYLNDVGTIWIFHYLMAANSSLIIWNRIFNQIAYDKLDDGNTNKYLLFFENETKQYSSTKIESTIRKEINNVFNAYTDQNFRKLGLISNFDKKVNFNKDQPIDDFVFLLLIYLFKETHFPEATTMDVKFICEEINGPGRIGLFTEGNIRKIIERLNRKRLIHLETQADLDQIRFIEEDSFEKHLTTYYRGLYE